MRSRPRSVRHEKLISRPCFLLEAGAGKCEGKCERAPKAFFLFFFGGGTVMLSAWLLGLGVFRA